MEGRQPGSSFTKVAIIGTGPSALILSYILHGNVPYYDCDSPHPDPVLHAKLQDTTDLLSLDIEHLTSHFEASRFSYSTQALPVNALLDALVRPHGETDEPDAVSCVKWRYEPGRAVSHLCFGQPSQPGGQWTGCPMHTSWDTRSLSYSGMLSLPGCSFYQHYQRTHKSPYPPYARPTRYEIAEYFAAYPDYVGTASSLRKGELVSGIHRVDGGFYIKSQNLYCEQLVLASGLFMEPVPPRPLLEPLLQLPSSDTGEPLLVIGSGFTAADIILSAPKDQRIIHIFKWEPDTKPSPLRSCHAQAYPEYAGVYRLMKQRATNTLQFSGSSSFLKNRPWDKLYEGFPNTPVTQVSISGLTGTIILKQRDGTTTSRVVSGLAYAVGRRGGLLYLDKLLQREVLGDTDNDEAIVTRNTLRMAAAKDIEISPGVFIIGSLTGDSLVRFAYGGCVYAAGKLMQS